MCIFFNLFFKHQNVQKGKKNRSISIGNLFVTTSSKKYLSCFPGQTMLCPSPSPLVPCFLSFCLSCSCLLHFHLLQSSCLVHSPGYKTPAQPSLGWDSTERFPHDFCRRHWVRVSKMRLDTPWVCISLYLETHASNLSVIPCLMSQHLLSSFLVLYFVEGLVDFRPFLQFTEIILNSGPILQMGS